MNKSSVVIAIAMVLGILIGQVVHTHAIDPAAGRRISPCWRKSSSA